MLFAPNICISTHVFPPQTYKLAVAVANYFDLNKQIHDTISESVTTCISQVNSKYGQRSGMGARV